MIQHPLSSFHYCPRCGQTGLEHVHGRAIHCSHCDLTYFHNVASAVACFVRDDAGRLLCVRRGREPAKGTLDLPGLTAGSVRYLFSIPNIYPYSGLDVYTADTFWLVRVPSFDGAEARDDAAELVIVEPRELEVRHFGLISVRSSIKRLLGDLSLLED